MIDINVGIHVKQNIIIKTSIMNTIIFVGTILFIIILITLNVTSIISQ